MTLVMSDGCLSSAVLAEVRELPNVYVTGNDQSPLLEDPFYVDGFLPAYVGGPTGSIRRLRGTLTGFDAANVIFDAIRRSAVIGADSTLTVGRVRLRSAILEIDGYKGLSGLLTCTSAGDCAQASSIAVYQAPFWPVAGEDQSTAAVEPVFRLHMTLVEAESLSSS